MSEISVFENELFGTLRAVEIDGSPWFVAADVATALGYSSTPAMVRSLDADEKGMRVVHTPGSNRATAARYAPVM